MFLKRIFTVLFFSLLVSHKNSYYESITEYVTIFRSKKIYNIIFNKKLVVDNYIVLYEVDEEYKQIFVYRVLYRKRDCLKIIE